MRHETGELEARVVCGDVVVLKYVYQFSDAPPFKMELKCLSFGNEVVLVTCSQRTAYGGSDSVNLQNSVIKGITYSGKSQLPYQKAPGPQPCGCPILEADCPAPVKPPQDNSTDRAATARRFPSQKPPDATPTRLTHRNGNTTNVCYFKPLSFGAIWYIGLKKTREKANTENSPDWGSEIQNSEQS